MIMKDVANGDECRTQQTFAEEMQLLAEKQFAYNVANLRKRLNSFIEENKFAPGQIVVWKEAMRNRSRPDNGQPAIVVEVLDPPLVNPSAAEKGSSSPYFNEPLDLIIGILDEDGDWLTYHMDSRRFRPLED